MKFDKSYLVLLFTFLNIFLFAQNTSGKIFETTFRWKPENGKNGCDATINLKLNYYLKNDRPWVNISYTIEKGNTVYFEGKQYARQQLGEDAYNAIRVQYPRFVVDLYDGSNFVTSIGFDSKGNMTYGGDWLNIFEGHIHAEHTKRNLPSGERAKEIFLSNAFSIKNMRLTYVDAINFHLVKMHALGENDRNDKSASATPSTDSDQPLSNNNGYETSQSNSSSYQSSTSAANSHYQNALERQQVYTQNLEAAATQIVNVGLSIANDIQQARIRNVNYKNENIREYLEEIIPLDKECEALYTTDYAAFLVKEKTLRSYENLAIDNLNWLIEKEGDARYKNLKSEIFSNQVNRLRKILAYNTAQLLKNEKELENMVLINEFYYANLNELIDFAGDLSTDLGYHNNNVHGSTGYGLFKFWRNFVDEEKSERARKMLAANETNKFLDPFYEIFFYVRQNYVSDYYDKKAIDLFKAANDQTKKLLLKGVLFGRNYVKDLAWDQLYIKDDRLLKLFLENTNEKIYYYEIEFNGTKGKEKMPLYKFLNSKYGFKNSASNALVKDWLKRDKKLTGKNPDDFVEEQLAKEKKAALIENEKIEIQKLISQSQVLSESGDFDKALSLIQKARVDFPNNYDLIISEAHIYNKLNNNDRFLELLKEGEKSANANDVLFFNIGVLEQANENYDEAENYYLKAIEINPENVDAYYNLGIVYSKQATLLKNDIDNFIDQPEKYDEIFLDIIEIFRKSISNYKHAVKLQEYDFDTLFEMGFTCTAQANEIGKQANKKLEYPKKFGWLYLKRMEMYNHSLFFFKKAQQLDDTDEDLNKNIIILQKVVDDFNEKRKKKS
ncbi:tetratricopeptide repeat protein [Cyclobacterium marinum]|uniref:tetratricopeptide repeat protein n=1 Tax=Cyclobacterium marinum TaxID=104 RepID=UPI0011F06C70|nr:tetratricopeptide repeat protein [Cyclobacterium marinum]MBI0400073.1 tetratricopeptide repeat protein [Cyclobacterium marinum]